MTTLISRRTTAAFEAVAATLSLYVPGTSRWVPAAGYGNIEREHRTSCRRRITLDRVQDVTEITIAMYPRYNARSRDLTGMGP